MSLEKFLDYLYTKFVIRDLLGKVLPGILLILGSAAILKSEWLCLVIPDKQWNLLNYFLLFGTSFTVGLVLQFICLPRFIWVNRRAGYEKQLESLYKVTKRSVKNEVLYTHRERFVVLKEMTGNMGMSLLILALLFGLCKGNWIIGVTLGLTSLVLLVDCWRHAEEQDKWERLVKNG
jgi:hypothetical protein